MHREVCKERDCEDKPKGYMHTYCIGPEGPDESSLPWAVVGCVLTHPTGWNAC
jgi:hypothetical protein